MKLDFTMAKAGDKNVGPIELQDDYGGYHVYDVIKRGQLYLIGSFTNAGLLSDFYFQMEPGESDSNAMVEILADLETAMRNGEKYMSRVKRVPKKGLKKNPPFYAHNLYEKKTHGLNLKQMRRLYAMVSRGNRKAITYARNVLGIPFSESPTQVKAVVYHHVRDLAERRVRRNPSRTRYMLVDRRTGKPISDVATWGREIPRDQLGYTVRDILTLRKHGIDTGRFKTVSMKSLRRNPYVTKGGRRILAGYAKRNIKLLGTGLKIDKGDLVLLEPATNIPGGGYFARPGYPTGIWRQVSEDDSIFIRPSEFKSDITFKRPVFGSKSFERMIRRRK